MNHLSGFVEAIGTILIITAFGYGVALLYVICSVSNFVLHLVRNRQKMKNDIVHVIIA